MAREGGIVANDVRGEARSQSLVSRREDTPPKSGAEHLGKMSLTKSRGTAGWWARRGVEGQMLTDSGVWSTIDALSKRCREGGQREPDGWLRAEGVLAAEWLRLSK
jgi:hypothetical protein